MEDYFWKETIDDTTDEQHSSDDVNIIKLTAIPLAISFATHLKNESTTFMWLFQWHLFWQWKARPEKHLEFNCAQVPFEAALIVWKEKLFHAGSTCSFISWAWACSSAELKEALPHHKSKSYGPSLRKKMSWRTLVLITHQVTSSSEQIITPHSLISYPWQSPTLEVSKKILRLLSFY